MLTAALIIMPLTAYSQMQNYVAYGNTSIVGNIYDDSERAFQPVKVMEYNDTSIVTLAHHIQNPSNMPVNIYDEKTAPMPQTDTSVFLFTSQNTKDIKLVKIPHCEIRDFDIENGRLYFCGEDLLTKKQFIVYTTVTSLFDGSISTMDRYNILFKDNYDNKLMKIRNSEKDGVYHKLALISNSPQGSSKFIDYTISSWAGSNFYETYVTKKYSLLDVLKTNDYICVLGKLKSPILPIYMGLFRHYKDSVASYVGKAYDLHTNPCNMYLDSCFHMTRIHSYGDDIAVGYTSPGRTYFGVMDVVGMNSYNVQYLSTMTDSCAKIVDMKYDEHSEKLFVVMCDGADKEDQIAEIDIYTPNSTVYITKPLFSEGGYNLLRSITLYDHNQYYNAVGMNTGREFSWFEKINYVYSDYRCHSVAQGHLTETTNMGMENELYYEQFYPKRLAPQDSLELIHVHYKYIVGCGLSN
ncbi:MAG: hypothetical protein J6M30_05610 [Bacteroidales bacterium]|nr:hypothetical protein [Bacteroidales bacterium]